MQRAEQPDAVTGGTGHACLRPPWRAAPVTHTAPRPLWRAGGSGHERAADRVLNWRPGQTKTRRVITPKPRSCPFHSAKHSPVAR